MVERYVCFIACVSCISRAIPADDIHTGGLMMA